MEAIGAIVGGSIAADGAEDAANIQAGATREANALQQKQYETTRGDLEPFRNLGVSSSNKLAQMLGLGGGFGAGGASTALSRDQLRAQLLPSFTTSTTARPIYDPNSNFESGLGWANGMQIPIGFEGGGSQVDEAALNAAIEERMTAQAEEAAQAEAARGDPSFGSLMREFTGNDLENEPGYQFGLKEGQRGLDRRAAAGGSYFSGNALKAAAQFGNDYASTKYGEAFNRDSANKTQKYNFLSGAVGIGQNAAAMTGNAGSNMAGQVGANITAMGNAGAASRIAQGNAWNNAIQGAVGGYQQNEMMNRITGGNAGWGRPQSGGSKVVDYLGAEY